MASNYDGIFVKVRPVGGGAWTTLPTPSTYKMTSSTIVDSARDTSGKVISNVIRAGVRKVEMGWAFLDQTQYTLVADFFDTNFYFEAYYYDTIKGTYQTKTFYCGDRVSDTAKIQCILNSSNEIVAIGGYVNPALSIIEV